ncbi:threonine/serine dehydratase [Taklimakanibacter lacteus]|uniref:threonine/serine dehydratase n=1 Tax=Taklimakanibacter lacteus TaxID=2268456 RepID=UPI0034D44D0A
MTTPAITLAAIEAAQRRIAGHIRPTPMIEVAQVRQRPVANPLFLKLECLQVTGSFKARGAVNRLLTTPPDVLKNGIVTASGGNHGMAVARAGLMAGIPTTIYLPPNASPAKVRALAEWNASVHVVGEKWDDADAAAREHAGRHGAVYFHPFKDPDIVIGQGTVALEMLDAVPEADVYLVAIGGGGLIAGLSTVVHARNPKARIIGIEPVGSPTLHAALEAGGPVRLERQWTRVATMSCGMTAPIIYDIVAKHVEEIVLVEDEHLIAAARWILAELAIRADLSAAAAIAALSLGKIRLKPSERISTLICGADDAALENRGTAG